MDNWQITETPLISIIVPCYNVENYLRKCVDSILGQTYRNLEVWLIDDGSIDATATICDEYGARDQRVNIVHKSNGGQSEARNVGIDRCSGEWITFVDSDDYITLDAIEILYHLAEDRKADISVMSFKLYRENTEPSVERIKYTTKDLTSEDALTNLFYQRDFETAPFPKLYHHSLFKSGIRYPNGLIYEDLSTTYLLIQRANKIAFTDKVGYYYLKRHNSTEEQPFSQKKYISCIETVKRMEADYNHMSRAVQKAMDCRITSFLFHVLLTIPKENEDMANTLLSGIKARRWRVLTDRNARNATRAACLLSYCGIGIIKFLYISRQNNTLNKQC